MSRVLIENGRIIDGAGIAPVDGSVLIDADKIIATGRQADAEAVGMRDLTRVDATGMTVMPGLIDVHCHLAFETRTRHSRI